MNMASGFSKIQRNNVTPIRSCDLNIGLELAKLAIGVTKHG